MAAIASPAEPLCSAVRPCRSNLDHAMGGTPSLFPDARGFAHPSLRRARGLEVRSATPALPTANTWAWPASTRPCLGDVRRACRAQARAGQVAGVGVASAATTTKEADVERVREALRALDPQEAELVSDRTVEVLLRDSRRIRVTAAENLLGSGFTADHEIAIVYAHEDRNAIIWGNIDLPWAAARSSARACWRRPQSSSPPGSRPAASATAPCRLPTTAVRGSSRPAS
jgi:hypothetical protein